MGTGMGRRGVVWKTPDITADGLKMFAWVMMLLQYIGVIIVEKGIIRLEQYTQEGLSAAMAEDSRLMTQAGAGSILQLLGGMAIPLFAFLLVEGFRNTSDYKKYLTLVAVFALVSEIPYDFAMEGRLFDLSGQNALVGTLISLLMLYGLRLVKSRNGFSGGILRFCIVLAAVVWAGLFRAEFGLCMVLLTAVFYIFYERNVLKTILGALISLLYVTGPISFYGIWCYNGVRRDKISKYVFYAGYPLMLLVLGMIKKGMV